jgi:hypothetical protein
MAHLNKIAANSPSRQHPSELEAGIAGAIYDLETNTADMKGALRSLQFVSAKEVSSFFLLDFCLIFTLLCINCFCYGSKFRAYLIVDLISRYKEKKIRDMIG